MSKKIFAVGLDLPGPEFEYISLDSDRTLLDADIIVFSPGLSNYTSHEAYNGKSLLSQHASFSVVEKMGHWQSEISAAVSAGKLVVVCGVSAFDYPARRSPICDSRASILFCRFLTWRHK